LSETARIPIADPAAEYRELEAQIDAAVRRALASGRYILGPEGAALERERGLPRRPDGKEQAHSRIPLARRITPVLEPSHPADHGGEQQ